MQRHLESGKRSTRYLLSCLKSYEKMTKNNSWNFPTNQPLDLLDCLRALAASGDTAVIPTLKRYYNRSPELQSVFELIENMGKTFVGLEKSLQMNFKHGIAFAQEGYKYLNAVLFDPQVSEDEKNNLLYLLWLNKEYPPERFELLSKMLKQKRMPDALLHVVISSLPTWKNEIKKLTPDQLGEYISFYQDLLYTTKDPRIKEAMLHNFEILNRIGTMSASKALSIIEKTPGVEETPDLLKVFRHHRRRLKIKASNAIKKHSGKGKSSLFSFLKRF